MAPTQEEIAALVAVQQAAAEAQMQSPIKLIVEVSGNSKISVDNPRYKVVKK